LGFVAYALTRPDTLVIYSSLPHTEQVVGPGPGRVVQPEPNTGIQDMENAMRLALKDAGGEAGGFEVKYIPLDASDRSGVSDAHVSRNAETAKNDDRTAVYIGDSNSPATQISIPILSRGAIPQISPTSTRVGLTTKDPRGDVDEPDRYYPNGYKNFVRIIPSDTVQAKALLAVMAGRDECRTAVMINDDSTYGEALANNILAFNRDRRFRFGYRMRFRFSQSVTPYGHYEHLVARAMKLQPDCFVYSGSTNPNTVEIFKKLAKVVPDLTLYGTDGVLTASFYEHIPDSIASRVNVMVPPRDRTKYQRFVDDFKEDYGHVPRGVHDRRPPAAAGRGCASVGSRRLTLCGSDGRAAAT
jgi:branched-chain amino acid transport system substrate-binding protein